MDNNTPSIITEQGYAAGEGLGVTPVSEADQEKLKKSFDDEDDE